MVKQRTIGKIGFALFAIGIAVIGTQQRVDKTLALQPVFLHAHHGDAHATQLHAHETNQVAEPTHSEEMPHTAEAMHEPLEIPTGQAIPSVNLVAHPDAHQGWNLEVQVTDFTFVPEQVNRSNLPFEGHAHLYIDGTKITRLYGNWYYLESLPSGRHEITVSLNTNDHRTLTHQGQPIEATIVLDVP